MLPSTPPLDDLVTTLRTLVLLAESGQWDEVAALDQKLQPLLKQLQGSDRLLAHDRIQEAFSLNQDALKRCKERIMCIEPLIKAFNGNAPEIKT